MGKNSEERGESQSHKGAGRRPTCSGRQSSAKTMGSYCFLLASLTVAAAVDAEVDREKTRLTCFPWSGSGGGGVSDRSQQISTTDMGHGRQIAARCGLESMG